MRISRFYCPEHLKAGAMLYLDKDTLHYIKNVLRHKENDELIVFNSDNGEFSARIKKVAKTTIQIKLGDQLREATGPMMKIHLGQGIARGEKMDLIVQKATELGVTEITPLFTEHCNVKLSGDRVEKRVAHWQRIAINACEQCGRMNIPRINTPLKLPNWLADRDETLRLICHPSDCVLDQEQTPESIVLLIGPEGGLSDYERDLAHYAKFVDMSLGPRILRCETAAISALSILQFQYGDTVATNTEPV